MYVSILLNLNMENHLSLGQNLTGFLFLVLLVVFFYLIYEYTGDNKPEINLNKSSMKAALLKIWNKLPLRYQLTLKRFVKMAVFAFISTAGSTVASMQLSAPTSWQELQTYVLAVTAGAFVGGFAGLLAAIEKFIKFYKTEDVLPTPPENTNS